MPTRKLARISAAQKACIRLHEIGELDDNFVPVSHTSEDEEDDEDYSTTDEKNDSGIKTGRNFYERKVRRCNFSSRCLPQICL